MRSLQIKEIVRKTRELSAKFYGDHTLDSIAGAGLVENPKFALVFINPTHRNISTNKEWHGLKAPWIGCANIWQLLFEAGLIDSSINNHIQSQGSHWSADDALNVYAHAAEKSLYLTNIVKWTGLDAKLPEREKLRLYAPLLVQELTLLKPAHTIAFGQLTYDGILRALGISTTEAFGRVNECNLQNNQLLEVQTQIGPVLPCYFPIGQGIKNRSKALRILQRANAEL